MPYNQPKVARRILPVARYNIPHEVQPAEPAVNAFRQITSQPGYYLITGLAIVCGASFGWIIHRQFPVVPIVPAIFFGALSCGAITSFTLLVRGAIAIARELVERIDRDTESDVVKNQDGDYLPDSSAPVQISPKDEALPTK